MKLRTLLYSLPLALSVACGGGQTRLGSIFTSEWENDGGRSIAAIQKKVAAIPISPGADVAVGVTDKGLVGAPLGGGAAWSFAHALDSRPALAGTVVVGTGGGEIFALDATTGKQLWSRKAGGALRGIGDDGRTTVVSLTGAGENASTVLIVAHDGSVVRQIEAKPNVGVPAVVGTYAFLPWQNQYVTVYDFSSGDEVARVLLREQVSRAMTVGKSLYFGEVGLFRFDDQIGHASENKATHVGLPTRELPGTPKWWNPGADTLPVAADARDKIQIYARPGAEGDLAIDSGRFVATYFRIAVGFDAKSGGLAWVHTHGSDLIGGAPYAGGTALCDADGTVTFLDAKTGGAAGAVALGQKVKGCVVQADGLTRPKSTDVRTLAQQIADALASRDADMAMIQKVLLRELANLDDEIVTKVLIDLAADTRTSPLLVPDARAALAARRNGAGYMIEALARHYDFLKDVLRPPPIGPIADALSGMKEKRAAAPLASHLLDPANSGDDVKRAAAALAVIGDKEQLPQLKAFFAQNRATADDEDVVAAVASAAQAILRIGGADGKAIVARAAQDPLTIPLVKQKLPVGDAPAEPPAQPASDAKPDGKAGPAPTATAAKAPPKPLPGPVKKK